VFRRHDFGSLHDGTGRSPLSHTKGVHRHAHQGGKFLLREISGAADLNGFRALTLRV
jgi:hypothetical protein